MQIIPSRCEVSTHEVDYISDPTSVFHSLCQSRSSTLLLESADIDSKQHLQSLLILASALRIHLKENVITLTALSINGQALLIQLDQALSSCRLDHFHLIGKREDQRQFRVLPIQHDETIEEGQRLKQPSIFDLFRLILRLVDVKDRPDKSLFLGGLFAYDLIGYIEDMPLQAASSCPDCCFYVAETLMVIDHQQHTSYLQTTLFSDSPQEKKRLQDRVSFYEQKLADVVEPMMVERRSWLIESNLTDEAYHDLICEAKALIERDELFQLVPSRQYMLPCPQPLAAYRVLKQQNPSPYMFYMQDQDFTLFGASPESALKYDAHSRQVELYPIAGTRPRGKRADFTIDCDLDNAVELALRTDKKELAEHIMLVDLARNDFAKICRSGSRYVAELLRVDRYSVVMHLVSKVVGELRADLDALHAYQSVMNMGTLTGAPKLTAMRTLAEMEKQARGSYGGAVGYMTGKGDMDTCIVIRSAYVEQGQATVQAGAGIVVDSDPVKERQETANKAKAVLDAICSTYARSTCADHLSCQSDE